MNRTLDVVGAAALVVIGLGGLAGLTGLALWGYTAGRTAARNERLKDRAAEDIGFDAGQDN